MVGWWAGRGIVRHFVEKARNQLVLSFLRTLPRVRTGRVAQSRIALRRRYYQVPGTWYLVPGTRLLYVD